MMKLPLAMKACKPLLFSLHVELCTAASLKTQWMRNKKQTSPLDEAALSEEAKGAHNRFMLANPTTKTSSVPSGGA